MRLGRDSQNLSGRTPRDGQNNAESDIVLQGLRRNGMLQYRPDKVEDAIFTDMPAGFHRIRDEWLADGKISG